jgi:hypothetical protein
VIARLRRMWRDDRGMSLADLMVGMALMGIFMTMFTGAVVLMTSSTNKVDASVSAADQMSQSYQHLDKLIRYASAISVPGVATGSGDWYVELSVPETDGKATCYQLRVDTATQQLQQRSWSVPLSGTVRSASAWLPLASGVSNGAAAAGSADAPFVKATTVASVHQQLRVTLLDQQSRPTDANAALRMTFTAVNSTSDYDETSAPSICNQQGARP